MKRSGLIRAGVIAGWLLLAPRAEGAIVRGIMEVVTGVLQIPVSTLAGTFNGPPIIGTVFGAITGVINGIGLVAHGALELAASGFEVAKTAAPYVLPFVF